MYIDYKIDKGEATFSIMEISADEMGFMSAGLKHINIMRWDLSDNDKYLFGKSIVDKMYKSIIDASIEQDEFDIKTQKQGKKESDQDPMTGAI